MMARNGAASTITSTFKIQVRYDLELRTAPQAPNCIGGSGGRMLYAPQWGVWGAKPLNGGFANDHVLDPHRCSKVSNSGFNGLKSSKLALYRRKKKFARVPFYKWVIL